METLSGCRTLLDPYLIKGQVSARQLESCSRVFVERPPRIYLSGGWPTPTTGYLRRRLHSCASLCREMVQLFDVNYFAESRERGDLKQWEGQKKRQPQWVAVVYYEM